MTWTVVVVLALGTYAFRWIGVTVLAGRDISSQVEEVLRLLPPAIIAGLVTTQTFASGGDLTIDARLPGVLAAGIAVLLRAPLIVVLLVALLTTALFRSTGVAT
ncbi:AzlD domain-containing protein [Euzebya tangerina]|uniref:AzlD domain-containing protein n=1 Tax=Euzebya tangerina TaxID=591198 RepID=UPI000E3191D3|nr:AzlD domain-containing protein [Euzebya tangerina]